jgi:hypothetical protein
MSTVEPLVFPDLLYLEDYSGNFTDFFNAVYAIFESHFIKSQPNFQGTRVSAQKFPLVDGIHRTFYHITHEGEDEANRTPDMRRMERIRFPKFCVESVPHDELLVWEKKIGRDDRIHIFNEAEGYIVVLTKRKDYLLFWTAFFIEKEHQRKKKIKEYEAYIKTKTA